MFYIGFHEWWNAAPLRQNLVNCSGCAEISSVLEVPESLRGTVALRRGPQLVLLKVRGQHTVGILSKCEELQTIATMSAGSAGASTSCSKAKAGWTSVQCTIATIPAHCCISAVSCWFVRFSRIIPIS